MTPLEDQHGNAQEPTLCREPIHSRVRRVHQRATALLSDALAPFGLTPPQWAALVALQQSGPMSQIDLGRSIAMDPATMQGVVVRLISRGFVLRGPDLHDRRRNVVSLVQPGHEVLAAAGPAVAKAERELSARLSPGEHDTLLDLLSRLGS